MAKSFLPFPPPQPPAPVLVLDQLFLPFFLPRMISFLFRVIFNYHFNTQDFQISIPAMTSLLCLSMYI